MAIKVTYGGNVAPSAVAAYGGGIGKRQAEASRTALQRAAAERDRYENERREKRAIRAGEKEAAASRTFAEEQAAKEQARRLETLGFNRNLEAESAADASRIRQEEALLGQSFREDTADAAQRRRQEDAMLGGEAELEFSQKQRDDYNALADAYAEAEASGNFSEDELLDIQKQLQSKRMGIKPQPRLKKKSQWPEGQGVGDVWTADTGVLLTRNEKGNVTKLSDAPKDAGKDAGQTETSVKDFASLYQQAYNSLDDANSDTTPKPEKVKAQVKEMLDLYKELVGGAAEAPVPDPALGAAKPIERVPGPASGFIEGGGKKVTVADVQGENFGEAPARKTKGAAFAEDFAAFGNLSPEQQDANVKKVTVADVQKNAAFAKDVTAFGSLSSKDQEAKVKAAVARSGGKLTEDAVWSMIAREASRDK